MAEPPQPELLPPETAPTDAVGINARCLLKTCDGHRVVLVAGMPIAHDAVGDAMAEAYAMVQPYRAAGRQVPPPGRCPVWDACTPDLPAASPCS